MDQNDEKNRRNCALPTGNHMCKFCTCGCRCRSGIQHDSLQPRRYPEIANLKGATEKRFGEYDSRLSAVEQHIDFFVNASQTPTGVTPA